MPQTQSRHDTAHPNPLAQAIQRAQQNLLRLQHDDGHWCGELFVDSTLCSDYVLFMHWADEIDPVIEDKCVAHIRRRQLEDGGWNIYEGGPSDVNATVKAYFALKLAGHWPGAVDGTWTPALTEALKAFQTELGVKATGTVDAATIAAVQKKAATGAKPQPSASASG